MPTQFSNAKIFFLALVVFPGAFSAAAQTSVFTYQGKLSDTGAPQPTSGTYDFLFRIYYF